METDVQVYALEEVVAEKLRTILQQADLVRRRGWSRSRARDYYDLWRILGAYREQIDLTDFNVLLREKCTVRDVPFEDPEHFFHESILAHVERTWEQWLGPLVPELLAFETVIGALRPQIVSLFA